MFQEKQFLKEQQSQTIEDYTLSQLLGQGQYGSVYKAYNSLKNNYYAVKVVKQQKFEEDVKLEEFTMNEIQALARIKNKNVVQFLEMIRTKNHYYFVYEFCNGGDLEGLLKFRGGFLSEDESLVIFRQLVRAFYSLVKENIMHRDLKPANILFHNEKVKLADFGFCKALQNPEELTSSMVGSPIYMAPEVLLGKSYGQKSDVWSLGCVLYEMIYGRCPFETNSMSELILMVSRDEVSLPEKPQISQFTQQILQKMLVKTQEKRISWQQIFSLVLGENQDQIETDQFPLNNLNSQIQIKNSSKAYLLLMQERNKTLFILESLKEILLLNFPSKNLPVIIFLYCKYLCQVSGILKIYIVENFNPAMFKNLSQQINPENLKNMQNSFEFKTYCKIVNKEYEYFMSLLPEFKNQCEKFKNESNYADIPDLQTDFNTSLLHQSLLQKVIIEYTEEIKTHFFNKILDNGHEIEMKKWLTHIAKLLDSLLLDEVFQNLMSLNQQDLRQQHYYNILNNYSKSDLLKLVTHKLDYLKRKTKKK